MSILSTFHSSTIATLQDVLSKGNIMKPSINMDFVGTHTIHLEVATRWSTEFECWLLDRSLPNDILGCIHDAPCRVPTRIERVRVFVQHLPWWKLQIGDCFSCRAALFENDIMKFVRVSSKHDMWPVGKRMTNQSIAMVHLFAGAFNGWFQAERFSHFHRKMPECDWSLSIDDDSLVCEMSSKNQSTERITNTKVVPDLWPKKHAVIQCKVEDSSWTKFVQSPVNMIWTVSFPCQPFSRGGSNSGVQTKDGQSIFHMLVSARVMQPIAILLENVDTFPTHAHAPTVFRFCIWAGYRIVWSGISDMASMSPHHRSRWLAVLIRQDLVDPCRVVTAQLPCLQNIPWNHPMFSFPVPDAMKDQLILGNDLSGSYGNWNLLPKGMGKVGPNSDQHQVLRARIPSSNDKLGTLVARYTQQHLLPASHTIKSGLFAQLTINEDGKCSFFDPIMWHALMGNIYTIFIHHDLAVAFHHLGNGLAVPQACLATIVAFRLLGLIDPEVNIEDIIVEAWNAKLTANQAMCIECEGGFAIATPNDFLIFAPLIRSMECRINAISSFTVIWPDQNRSVMEWNKPLSVAQILQWCSFPPHLSKLWGIWLDPENIVIKGTDIFPQGSKCGKFVFLPEITLANVMHPSNNETNEDCVIVSETCPWTQAPQTSEKQDDLTSLVITLPEGESRNIECSPMRIVEEVAILAGFTGDVNTVEAWINDEKIPLDVIVRPFHQSHIRFVNSRKRKTLESVSKREIVLEIVSLAGTTRFIPTQHESTIWMSLVSAGFSIEFIRCLSATCNGRLIPLHTHVGSLQHPSIRLCAFPLKGGAPNNGKDKENRADPFQKNDPWASYNEKSTRSIRWEELKLPSNHPWFGKDGKRLNLVTVLQLGPDMGGVAFATKASVCSLMSTNPNPQTVVLVPGLKGLGQFDERVKQLAQNPKEVVVLEPGTNKMYKRLVIPIVFGDGIDFKHEDTDKTIEISSSQFAELVIECHSKILPQGAKHGFGDKPLEAFQRLITSSGISMQEVTIYAYRQIKLQEATVFQAMIKAPEQARIPLLKWSGTIEAFVRQFIQRDQELDHSILPRYWQVSLDEMRMARQLGETLDTAFLGIALTGKGLAIRSSNAQLKIARAAILRSDSRFNETNGHVVCKKIWVAQGFPFAISHDAVIQATLSGTGKPPIPLRSYKNAGMLNWVLGFQEDPPTLSFTIKVSDCVHEILLTPQGQLSQPKGRSKMGSSQIGKQGKPQGSWTNTGKGQSTVPAINTQINSSDNDRRIGELERKMTSLESKHSHLADKVDGRFDEVAEQLKLILGAVAPQQHPKTKGPGPSGETPPPKAARNS